MCFCFVLGAQAQITKIDTYSNRISSLSDDEKKKMDFLFFGLANRSQINDLENAITASGPVRVLELNYNDIDKLKDQKHSNSFQKIRVISINWEKGKLLDLKEEDLKDFLVLKYILIKGYESMTKEELKSLFSKLSSSEEISDEVEIIYYKMNPAS